MAKKHWHNKHVSTKWGVAILGFLILSLLLLIPYLNQRQNSQSEAAYKNEGTNVTCRYTFGSKNAFGCSCNDKVGCKAGLFCKPTNKYSVSGTCRTR